MEKKISEKITNLIEELVEECKKEEASLLLGASTGEKGETSVSMVGQSFDLVLTHKRIERSLEKQIGHSIDAVMRAMLKEKLGKDFHNGEGLEGFLKDLAAFLSRETECDEEENSCQ